MASYAMLCYAMLCYAMLCYAMVSYGMLWYCMVRCGVVWYGMANAAQPIMLPTWGSNKTTGLHLRHAQAFLQKELNDIETVAMELGELRAAIGSLDAQSWYEDTYTYSFYEERYKCMSSILLQNQTHSKKLSHYV